MVGDDLMGTGPAGEFATELASPKFLADDIKPSAIERGQLTHLVLQYLDFSGLGDECRCEHSDM